MRNTAIFTHDVSEIKILWTSDFWTLWKAIEKIGYWKVKCSNV